MLSFPGNPETKVDRELTDHERDVYNMAGHVFAASGCLACDDRKGAELFLLEARELADKMTKEIDATR